MKLPRSEVCSVRGLLLINLTLFIDKKKQKKGRKKVKKKRVRKKVYPEKWPNNATRFRVDSARGSESPTPVLELQGHPQNLEPCISELGTRLPCKRPWAFISLSILHVLLFSWSLQVAFLQHGQTEVHIFRWWAHCIFGEELWWDFRTELANYGLKMEALAALHLYLGWCLGESVLIKGWISPPKWESAHLSPSQGLESALCHTPQLSPSPGWQDPRLSHCCHAESNIWGSTCISWKFWEQVLCECKSIVKHESWVILVAFHRSLLICQEPRNTIAV